MNGRAAKRIQWAAYRIAAGIAGKFSEATYQSEIKRLKREYYEKPYHLRKIGMGIRSLSHREQRERWTSIR